MQDDKPKDDEVKEKSADSEEEDDDGQKMLYRYIFDPTKERLPELTDLPLSKIDPLSWMATFDAVLEEAVAYVQYAIDLRRYKNALKSGDKEVKKPEPPKATLPSEVYREWYYKHRRSLAGSGLKTAAVLAERQLEVQQEIESPDQLKGLSKD